MYVRSENSPHYFSSTVVLRTYILWATAGTTGITVVNLRSRNTKQTQIMREVFAIKVIQPIIPSNFKKASFIPASL